MSAIIAEAFSVAIGDRVINGVVTKQRLAAVERHSKMGVHTLLGCPMALVEAMLVACCDVPEAQVPTMLDQIDMKAFLEVVAERITMVYLGGQNGLLGIKIPTIRSEPPA